MARTGQAEAQAGARQCMHCFLAKRSTPGAFSVRFTTVKTCSATSRRWPNTASPSSGGGRWLASLQAASQARQPTHSVVSTSTPGPSSTCADPEGDAAAAAAPAVPAVTAAILKNPLRPIFMWSPRYGALGAGRQQVEGPEHRDSDHRRRECEHHGVARFGPAGGGDSVSASADRSTRSSASRKSGHALNESLSQVLAVVTRSSGTSFFTG